MQTFCRDYEIIQKCQTKNQRKKQRKDNYGAKLVKQWLMLLLGKNNFYTCSMMLRNTVIT